MVDAFCSFVKQIAVPPRSGNILKSSWFSQLRLSAFHASSAGENRKLETVTRLADILGANPLHMYSLYIKRVISPSNIKRSMELQLIGFQSLDKNASPDRCSPCNTMSGSQDVVVVYQGPATEGSSVPHNCNLSKLAEEKKTWRLY
jgi:hypothetical protein